MARLTHAERQAQADALREAYGRAVREYLEAGDQHAARQTIKFRDAECAKLMRPVLNAAIRARDSNREADLRMRYGMPKRVRSGLSSNARH